MRVWLDPEKLASRNLTAGDVANALREQNVQVAAGQIGQPPVPRGLDFQYTMTTLGRLSDPEQFARDRHQGRRGRPGHPAQGRGPQRLGQRQGGEVLGVELGAKSQDQSCTLDGKPSVGLAIFQLPGSNALKTAEAD